MAAGRTLPEVVADGDRRASLEALRDALAQSIASAEPENVAALAKQLRDTLRELAELPVKAEVSPLDEIRARRQRRADAAPPGAAGKRQQPRKRSG